MTITKTYDQQAQERFSRDLDKILGEIGDLLKKKNASYGDSVLDPIRIFSKANAMEQLRVRIDDKLSRLARGDPGLIKEDIIRDLIGYLVIHEIAVARLAKEQNTWNPAG